MRRSSRLKRSTGEGPTERFGEHVVEVLDECERAVSKILDRCKAGTLEKTTRENRKPKLHLIEPRAVPRRVNATNPVRRVLEELPARLLRLQDPLLALHAEIFLDPAASC